MSAAILLSFPRWISRTNRFNFQADSLYESGYFISGDKWLALEVVGSIELANSSYFSPGAQEMLCAYGFACFLW